jgi:hypothetical protein
MAKKPAKRMTEEEFCATIKPAKVRPTRVRRKTAAEWRKAYGPAGMAYLRANSH